MNYFASNVKSLRLKKGLKQAEILDFLGIPRTTWSSYEQSASQPDIDGILGIAEFFGVSVADLLNTDLTNASLIEETLEVKNSVKSKPKSEPKGKPNVESGVSAAAWTRMPKVVTVDMAGKDNVVLVPSRARAGYLAGYEDPEFIQSLPAYRLPGLTHGTFRMFEVYGHSMVPTFHESDIIVTRYVENLLEIRDDRIYVVVSKRDGVVVKRVVNRVQLEGKLILNSDNLRHAGDYPPIIVSPEEVLEIWYAVAYMSRQMRAPGEMYNRLLDVETRLTLLEDKGRKGAVK